MKYKQLEQEINTLQNSVDLVYGSINIKDTYDNCVLNYLSEKHPGIYFLKGIDYKKAKFKMRNQCFDETTGLVNIIINDIKVKERKLIWEQKIRKEINK